MDLETTAAPHEMAELAESFPGAFKPAFELGYWAGVSEGAERWYVRFEGDIRDTQFTVLGYTAAEALRKRRRRREGAVPRSTSFRSYASLPVSYGRGRYRRIGDAHDQATQSGHRVNFEPPNSCGETAARIEVRANSAPRRPH